MLVSVVRSCYSLADMQISWHGLTCVEIVTKTSTGEVTVVTDPFAPSTGAKLPRTLDAHLVTVSHKGDDADHVGGITGTPFIIDVPGEYESKGVFVYGISAPTAKGENTIMLIESEDLSLAHLGVIDRDLSSAELEQLKDVDILLLPVGGGRTLNGKKAAELVATIEPRIVIPLRFDSDGVKETLEPVGEFLKAMGGARKEETSKFKISRKDLPEEDTLIVVLTP